jgi:membrane-associated phospholipid phosphatase
MNLQRLLTALLLVMLLAPRAVPGQDNQPQTQPDPAIAASVGQAAPPSSSFVSTTKHFTLDIWTDQKAIWSSPFRMNRRQLLTIALPVAALTAGLIATDEKTSGWLPNTPRQVAWSNGISALGSTYTLGGVVAGSLIMGQARDKPTLSQMGHNSAEALVNATIVSCVMKLVAGRERPDWDKGEGRFWKGGNSFPSGHAMASWSVAAAIAHTRGCPKWLAITSYAVASAVSVSRYTAHKHFLGDVFVGSVFGSMIGDYAASRTPNP